MHSMFDRCESLIFLNLSSFDTTQVTEMDFIFSHCLNLLYLDISHFSPMNISTIKRAFYNMSSLIYLNIKSLEIQTHTDLSISFRYLPSNF